MCAVLASHLAAASKLGHSAPGPLTFWRGVFEKISGSKRFHTSESKPYEESGLEDTGLLLLLKLTSLGGA